MNPLLAVCLVTYNHVKYIEQAIESVLKQQVKFTWQLVIADDFSTDGTREILIAYQQKHPKLIKLILQEKNVGANQNWIDLISYPTTKYIAYLDGDDYWTDTLKLQKQVDFLEANPDYSICAHPVRLIENGILQMPSNLYSKDSETFTIEDLAKKNLLHSSSVIYRNNLINTYPTWLKVSPVCDYVSHMLNAKKGKIRYLPEPMSVYRVHAEGIWSGKKVVQLFKEWLLVLSLLLTEDFDEKVIGLLKIQKTETAIYYLEKVWKTNPDLLPISIKELAEEDKELGNELLTSLFVNEYLEFKKIKEKYYPLKNSRLRKYLSHIFKQLKL